MICPGHHSDFILRHQECDEAERRAESQHGQLGLLGLGNLFSFIYLIKAGN